jgi:putative ABC transport system permease protein
VEIQAIKDELLKNPLIEGVAAASNPIGLNDIGGHDFAFEKKGVMQESNQMAKQLFVDEDFLKTINVHFLQGRNFSKDIKTDQSTAMIINETLMKELEYANGVGKKSSVWQESVREQKNLTIVE